MICCEDCTSLIAVLIVVFALAMTLMFWCINLDKKCTRMSQELKKIRLKNILKSMNLEPTEDFNDLLED